MINIQLKIALTCSNCYHHLETREITDAMHVQVYPCATCLQLALTQGKAESAKERNDDSETVLCPEGHELKRPPYDHFGENLSIATGVPLRSYVSCKQCKVSYPLEQCTTAGAKGKR